jgi:hypothetical protein
MRSTFFMNTWLFPEERKIYTNRGFAPLAIDPEAPRYPSLDPRPRADVQ